MRYIDGDDGLVVIELAPGFDWATFNAQSNGVKWMQRTSP